MPKFRRLATSLVLLLTLIISSLFGFTTSVKAQPFTTFVNNFDITTYMCDVGTLFAGLPLVGPLLNQFTANREWYNQTFCQFHRKVFDTTNEREIFGERYTFAQINWITNSLNSLPIVALNNIVKAYLVTLPGYGIVDASPVPQNRLSFVTEVHSFLEKFNLATPVHAQGGFGYQTSQGLRTLWSASRNSALLLSALAVIILGFMVMFRVKINPQTAVSIQMAIPRIALTLIGIIFSYALAGLIIDLIYVLLGFVIYIAPASIFTDPNNRSAAFNFFTRSDFFGILIYFVAGALPLIASTFLFPIVGIIISFLFLILIGRLFWKLISTYFMFILTVIVGPWQILLGLLPGPGGGYLGGLSKWFRTLLGHAVVFLVIPLMILINQVFWNGGTSNIITTAIQQGGAASGYTPGIAGISITDFPSLPLFSPSGPIVGVLFGFLLGLAALAIAPKLADQAREKVIGSKDAGYTSAIGEALGTAAGLYSVLDKERRNRGLQPISMVNPALERLGTLFRQSVTNSTPQPMNRPKA